MFSEIALEARIPLCLYKNRHLGYSKFNAVFLEVEDFFHHRCRIRIYTLLL